MGTVRSPFRRQVQNPSAAAEAKLTNLRCKFKDSREVVKMIKGMKVERASQYLNNVILKKEAVTATKFKNGRGRHAQAKQFGSSDVIFFNLIKKYLRIYVSGLKK
ncbi:MAG: 60S ribosomal protein L17 [Paramarteilia canceri]